LSNSRPRPDGAVEVAAIDLGAVNRLDPPVATADVTENAGRSRVECDLVADRQELAALELRDGRDIFL
jgi:hypothetical protein